MILCISIILLINKRKILKYFVKIVLIILSIISMILISLSIYFAIVFGKYHPISAIQSLDGAYEIVGLELFYTDYEIIKYEEHEIYTNKNIIQMNFELKITNMEKLNILKNNIIPIIYVFINDRKFVAKGQLSVLSTFPEEADCMFPIDDNRKIVFFENNIISFLGFENRN
jgi:hypothetical protein